jgi:hypothetical protein
MTPRWTGKCQGWASGVALAFGRFLPLTTTKGTTEGTTKPTSESNGRAHITPFSRNLMYSDPFEPLGEHGKKSMVAPSKVSLRAL